MPNLAEKKKNKSVNTMVMLFLFLIGFAILTHIIPSGSYVRENINGRDYVIPNSYTQGGGQSIGFFDIFEVIPLGFAKGVALIFNFLAVGGAFEVLKSTGAINTGISAMIRKIGIKRGNIILVLLFAIFSTLGAFLGLTDAAIPFIPIAMSIALALGYDPLVALGVTVLGAYSGSMPGPTNPSSVGICHQIAGLVPFSGIGFRLVEWAIIAAVTLAYVMLYAKRVSKDYSNRRRTWMYSAKSCTATSPIWAAPASSTLSARKMALPSPGSGGRTVPASPYYSPDTTIRFSNEAPSVRIPSTLRRVVGPAGRAVWI